MDILYQAAEKAVKYSLKLKAGEEFLLITDKQKLEIAEALAYWAKAEGVETTTYMMTETLRPIKEPTAIFREMMSRAQAAVYLLDARIEEKPFRGYMVKAGTQGRRICMMPGITREMMERLVNIDYNEMDVFTQKIVDTLQDAEQIVVENSEGTDIRFSVRGRRWKKDNGDISREGMHGNLPAGECFTAPVEESFSGKLVISLIDDKPGRGEMIFREGRLIEARGSGIEQILKEIGDDESGKIIGEFGIGTNPGARICPNMLEAEKAYGTVHFAIGDSYGIGRNSSAHHYDALVDKVTIRTGQNVIVENGRFLI